MYHVQNLDSDPTLYSKSSPNLFKQKRFSGTISVVTTFSLLELVSIGPCGSPSTVQENTDYQELMASDAAAKELLGFAKNRLNKFHAVATIIYKLKIPVLVLYLASFVRGRCAIRGWVRTHLPLT